MEKLANNKHCMRSVEVWAGKKKEKEISPSFFKKTVKTQALK